jgi:acyl transferase domain-containing protein/NAD(P)H-dependent flavin oxidoreductase YrpB (nitropropane dioxygenase family)
LEGQLRAIQEARPPFAVVAGGYAGVAAALEAGGTRTYLHAPSPELLEGFVADGLRRFVLEGHECGGHVGPLSGFVLWELAIAKLLQAPLGNGEWARLRVIFAGGIHDGLGGAMISVMAQPLVERKAQIGVLIGTGYIFTEEIVSTGAVVPGFQEVAMRSDYTVRLETGPGHALRCADTPYCTEFAAVKRKLLEDNFPRQAVRERLERMNRGRLRIASKGLEHCEDPSGGGDCLKPVDGESQLGRGIYMLGQAAAIRQCRCTIRQLHEEVCDGAVTRLKALQPEPPLPATAREAAPLPLEVAIVGMACFLPGAKDLAEFWDNILRGRCALREIPADRFDWRHWYDPQCGAPDKMCARVGGFIDDLPFDPLKYGIPPASLPHIEPIQLLALELVDRALGDAGCRPEGSRRERTAVILGAGGVTGELAGQYLFRSMLPQFFAEPPARITSQLAQWTEDSFAGILTSVIAGRVANRFDLGGVNFAVDAACASSLAAVYVACRELAAGACDLVIAGGCDTLQMPFAYVGFSTAGALSPSGRCRIFDRSADGIVISEGLSAVVLKRLADAERDGDRVYAVIRAAAGGSDGRCKGITAPRKEGQLLTLARAYAQARFSCASVDLFEAHGTGTVVGDRTECESLAQLLEDAGAAARTCAVGSVKSNVGHTKSAAGVTGLIKAALAVYHRVLPPTLDVESVDPAGPLAGGPLYVNTELRPWIRGSAPRRAGVSSFGFGGTNFHVVLEEYEDDLGPRRRGAGRRSWPAELFPLSALSREGLLDAAKSLAEQARRSDDGQDPAALANLAYRQHCQGGDRSGPWRAAVVAESVAQLHDSLVALAAVLAAGEAAAGVLPPNVFFAEKPLGGPSSLAMLFPGQGSQYPNMLRDLTVEFTELSECFQEADAALVPRPSSADTLGATAGLSSSAENTVGQANRGTRHFTSVEALGEPEPGSGTATAGADSAGDGTRRPEPSASAEPALSRYIFPPPALSPDELDEQAEALKATDVTQPALGACSVGLLRLLGALGITSGAVAGHSYGELVALHAAGSLDFLSLVRLSRARGRAIADAVAAPGGTRGSMLAVAAGEQVVRGVLDRLDGVWIANFNGPRQIVISGTDEAIAQAAQRFEDRRVQCHPLPVACAFHTPFMAPAKERFEHKLHEAAIRPPAMNVYSNSRAALYPAVPEEMRCVLAEQLLSPVRFAEQIERMYDAGCRVFLEVGPNQVLTRLVGEILADRPHVAVATQPKTEHGLTSLLRALGQLFAHGIPCKLGRLYETRDFPPGGPEFSGTTGDPKCRWLVSGAYARPAAEPPRRMPSRIEPERNGRVGAAPVAPVAPATPPAPVAARPQPAERVLPPERPAPPDLGDDFAQFQDTMRLFLETQRRVMTAYFGGATPTPDVEPRSVVEAGLQPPEPVTMDSRLPASPVAEPPPVAAPTEAQPLPETPHDLTAKLLQVVSRSTGYPADMLDLNANIEADMGIDSIKRLEIVAAFRRLVLPSVVDLPGWFTERMKAAKSLQEILDGVRELLQRSETGH